MLRHLGTIGQCGEIEEEKIERILLIRRVEELAMEMFGFSFME